MTFSETHAVITPELRVVESSIEAWVNVSVTQPGHRVVEALRAREVEILPSRLA
jgi:hypothetical protein